jgi:hypothetical protein
MGETEVKLGQFHARRKLAKVMEILQEDKGENSRDSYVILERYVDIVNRAIEAGK